MATSAPAAASDAATTAPMRRVPVISAVLPARSIHYLYPAEPRAARGPGRRGVGAPAVERPVAGAREDQADEPREEQQRVLEAVSLSCRARPIQEESPREMELPC